jgi:hypothetical protein
MSGVTSRVVITALLLLVEAATGATTGARAGPCRYSGDSMKEVHMGLHISEAEFYGMIADLRDVLEERHVSRGATNEPAAHACTHEARCDRVRTDRGVMKDRSNLLPHAAAPLSIPPTIDVDSASTTVAAWPE